MANVLDRIIQKVDIDPKDNDKATKAYSNMMVYLRELKLHNIKNLELAEQIYALSETNVDKLNEIQETNNIKFSEIQEANSEKLEHIQQVNIEKLNQIQEVNVEKLNAIHDIISDRLNDDNETEKDALTKINSAIEELQQKVSADRDNDVRVLKREMAVLNSSMEEALQNQINQLEEELKSTKKTLLIYMRVIVWILVMIIFLVGIQFLPIFH